jgi:hypothetical protein
MLQTDLQVFFFENLAVYEITWKIFGRFRQAVDENTIRRMRIACVVTKATDAHLEYIIFRAFPRQQWLGARA